MIVRWKPMLILSGLFVVVAMMGVLAMAFRLAATRADALQLARTERAEKNFEHALIYFKQALQKSGKNPIILEEIAELYKEWAKDVPATRAEHLTQRRASLADAAKYGKQRAEPRRQLLIDAMHRVDPVETVAWAKELLALDPRSADAHYALAEEALASNPPNLDEAKRHLTVLDEEKPDSIRTEWVKARVAEEEKDETGLDKILERVRTQKLARDPDSVDGMALLRLRALDAQRTTDPTALVQRVEALKTDASGYTSAGDLPNTRIAQLSLVLEKVQKFLGRVEAGASAAQRARASALSDSIEEVAESTFKKALVSRGATDLGICQAYAEHLRVRGQYERCLAEVDKVLKSELALVKALSGSMMNLREVAIKAALSNTEDPERFERAETYIEALLASKNTHFAGLGHLFRGAIYLERSGQVNGAPAPGGQGSPASQAKLGDEALDHLRQAAEQLPRLSAAQALYGVGLIQSHEPGLGRQYLQTALRLGNIEPRYQMEAAWSMVQAGYPEEAEPIVAQLFDEVERGSAPRELAGALHRLRGEIHFARRTPDELKAALTEFGLAVKNGLTLTPAIELRLAQIEVMLGNDEKGLERLSRLRESGLGGPPAEQLLVMLLIQQQKEAEAERVLAEARRRFPESHELVKLEAAMRVKADQPEQADRLLADYLTRNPDQLEIIEMRAQLLVEQLKRVDDARTLLANAAERSHNSGPLFQLAFIDLQRRDFAAVSRSIAQIRGSWKESAAADQLEAQLAVIQGDLAGAVAHYAAALKKDPGNKVVQLAKAELDRQTGATAEATKALEEIAKNTPVKALDSGRSLAAAAQLSLAAQALAEGQFDEAIHRLEDLIHSENAGALARPARWQLVAARAAKGDWPAAKRELAALLNDTQAPPTLDERVRAATLYRKNNEEPAAVAQLDYVLKQKPGHPSAVVERASILTNAQPPQPAAAAALLRKAIASTQEPPAVFYLMLAAVENITPPKDDGLARANIVLDQGLEAHPGSIELVKAKYRVTSLTQGPKAALALIEGKAQGDTGALRRLLAETYRDRQEYAQAEQVVRGLLKANPKDHELAAELVRLVAAQAIQAADTGAQERERALNDQTAALIRQFRSQFPTDLNFPQAECELSLRRGDLPHALAVADEVEAIDNHSPIGPIMRARVHSAQGRHGEVAKAFHEALTRNPNQPQVRLWLAQACLALGQADEALDQASRVLETNPDQPTALLIKARALATQTSAADQAAANREQAIQLLTAALQKQPGFTEAYHAIAEIQMLNQKRGEAIATLKSGLKAAPSDSSGLGMLVRLLTEPQEAGAPASREAIHEAEALAEQYGGHDEKGALCLALAVGFQKASQIDLALPWAEKAAMKLNGPSAHLTFGELLMVQAEATTEKDHARTLLKRALAQYDLVLEVQANSVEAINNKAWILHRYLGDHQAAYELVQGLLRRSDPSTLPAEFSDTVGAVQEALGKLKEAEQTYAEGLRKSPDQPMLNYHMGRLLAADPARAERARGYLEKALASSNLLPRTTLAEVESLLKKMDK